jgi:hypothetical protein
MNTPLSRFAKLVYWFVAVNALAAALSLMLFPTETNALFFWEITPPLNAALFGALYLGGALVVGFVAWRGEWEPSRFLVPVLVSAGILISLTTFLHLNRFEPGLKLAYWLVIYIGATMLALLIYAHQERAGANWAVSEPVRPVTRAIAVGLGAVLTALGIAVLISPGFVVANWPWPTTPLMTRIFVSWFTAFGVGLLWFIVERDWGRIKLIAVMMIGASALDLLMLFAHRADVPPGGINVWVYGFHLALFGVVGALLLWLQRKRSDQPVAVLTTVVGHQA